MSEPDKVVLERWLNEWQAKLIEVLSVRKQQLLLKQEFDKVFAKGESSDLTQAIFAEIFRRTFGRLDSILDVIYTQRQKLREQLRQAS